MAEGELPQRGTGFVGRGGRTLFFALALAPGIGLVALALLNGPIDLVPALVMGVVLFVFVMFFLLLIGRSVEYIRDAEWRGSPNSLANAPVRYRVWAFALIAVSNAPIVQELFRDVSLWPFWLMACVWNTFVMSLFAHFFAVKIFRFVERLVKRGKQSL